MDDVFENFNIVKLGLAVWNVILNQISTNTLMVPAEPTAFASLPPTGAGESMK